MLLPTYEEDGLSEELSEELSTSALLVSDGRRKGTT